MFGHQGEIWDMIYLPDWDRLATASQDRTIKIWELMTGTFLLSFHAHTDTVTSLCYLNDGRTIISGSVLGELKIWDIKKAVCSKEMKGHYDIVSKIIVIDKLIISSSWDGTIKGWDLT